MIITQWLLEWPGRIGDWGQWNRVHQGPLSRDRSRWPIGPQHAPPCHKLFPSCGMQVVARYTAKPLCLVAAGDKAWADGKVVVLALWQRRGQLRSLSYSQQRKTPESTQHHCVPSEGHK